MILWYFNSHTYHRTDVSFPERLQLFLSSVTDFLQNDTKICSIFSNHQAHREICVAFLKVKYILFLFYFNQANHIY